MHNQRNLPEMHPASAGRSSTVSPGVSQSGLRIRVELIGRTPKGRATTHATVRRVLGKGSGEGSRKGFWGKVLGKGS